MVGSQCVLMQYEISMKLFGPLHNKSECRPFHLLQKVMRTNLTIIDFYPTGYPDVNHVVA